MKARHLLIGALAFIVPVVPARQDEWGADIGFLDLFSLLFLNQKEEV